MVVHSRSERGRRPVEGGPSGHPDPTDLPESVAGTVQCGVDPKTGLP